VTRWRRSARGQARVVDTLDAQELTICLGDVVAGGRERDDNL
jgi:hypothetical protein